MDHLQVLIVDDEYYFRQLLLHLIDWPALGFTVTAEAENGAEALELAHSRKFDLIIADINMPGMTGLDFVEALRLAAIPAKVIFITSYDIFEYARAAVALGASHYLLKPVDEEELEKALKEIREELLQQRRLSETAAGLKLQLERAKPLLREQFLRQHMLHEPAEGPEVLQEQAKFYEVPANACGYAALIAEIDELALRYNKEQERQLWRFAVKNIVQETMEASGVYCAAIDGDDGKIAVFLALPEFGSSRLTELCERARSFINGRMRIFVTFAVGQIYESLSQAHLSYAEALYVLKHKFIQGGNRVIAYAPDREGWDGFVFSLPIDRSEWVSILRNNDREGLLTKIRETCQRLIDTQAGKEMALFVLMECISLGSAIILERGGSLPKAWLMESHPLFKQMYGIETVDAMERWLQCFFGELVAAELSKPSSPRGKSSEIVQKAIGYIQEHYADEAVTLQLASRSIGVNPSYLSHMFKKETGIAFTEYLSDLRLERAMELLREASPAGLVSLKVVDVSQSVGYADPYYFSRCFKKKFGIVPSKILQS
ncbi:response regulator [Paenibacillus cremeus]|uniref:response regulator n=1 Tax=Paenibacillus cremeus TaxID=2163881 RepID=UPI001647158B|nr:response regulator [Paenibacillus cremeus]